MIVDEIHAVAATKRGSHLALTLERLEAQAERPLQRIGLSATQNPLEEIGRFLVGPRREVTILDAGHRKQLDLRIEVPVESMSEPGGPAPASDRSHDPLEPVPGGESTRGSIWPAIYPELLKQVKAHNSTIVFVNNRRSAERVALRLNELAAKELEQQDEIVGDRAAGPPPGGDGPVVPLEIARAHHGSLAREERTKVEELLKAGELPCLVATSSLELGIDMGAVDLVLQIESPKSVARGLQRIGRAGHGVDEVSRGRIFPKFRGDLLECAVVARRMHEGLIEPTVVPRNALDVLAQQIVAIAVSAEPAKDSDGEGGISVDDCTRSSRAATPTRSSRASCSRTCSTCSTGATRRRTSASCARASSGIASAGRFARARARASSRSRTPARSPTAGSTRSRCPTAGASASSTRRWSTRRAPDRPSCSAPRAWRIEEIGRDRVIVTPAPGAPGAVPFWKGDSVGRPKELGEAIGAFSRWAVEQEPQTLQRDYDLDERAARNLLHYLREQQEATRVLPSERTIVLERFRDEIGDWRLCVLSPFGGRVHSAWGLAISARIRERIGLEADAISSDDGIVCTCPTSTPTTSRRCPSAAELIMLEPEEVEAAITAELGGSALFGARFRENASRALLIPRAYPGKRTPLWQQRLKAQNLLEVARRYDDFPIVLETYRECLRDVLDVPGLQELLRALHAREISLVEVETPTASPFASSLLFDYVATYMYEGDTPSAERRAAALSLDRDLLRELLGQEELRELLDPRRARACRGRPAAPLGDHARDRPRRAARRAAPRRRPERGGDRRARVRGRRRRRRCSPSSSANAARSACASAASSATSPPTRPGSIATRWRRRRPAACRKRSSPTCPTRCACSSRATRARTARSRRTSCASATASTRAPCCASSSATARSCAASCDPAAPGASGATSRCCGACAAPRWRRCARRSSRPTSARSPPSCRRGRASTATPRRRRDRPPARGARAAAGARAAGGDLGARRAAAAHRRLLAVVARHAVRERRARVGRRRAARALRAASRCTSARTRR